jgi:hypothetical protein
VRRDNDFAPTPERTNNSLSNWDVSRYYLETTHHGARSCVPARQHGMIQESFIDEDS